MKSFGMAMPSYESTKPNVLVWCFVVFVLVIQQSAFVEMPAIAGAFSDGSQDINALNTLAVMISLGGMTILAFFNSRQIWILAQRNGFCLLYIALVLSSIAWSIYPDLTFRRGLGYVLSMLIAAYLTIRFDDDERMKVISASFAVSAIGSILYVIAFPSEGIMQAASLEGTWRGVFPHKNVLGPVMAVAVFVELYILVASKNRSNWRFLLLFLYFALIALSRSATALLLATGYLTATLMYVVWKRDRLTAIVAASIAVLFSLAVVVLFLADPDFILGLLGKDAGLTGRTELWDLVIRLIGERPILGYGYRAMWSPYDFRRILMDEATGGWGITQAQNAILEIALELGLVGAIVLIMNVLVACWRAVICSAQGISLGPFLLFFIAGTLAAGMTEVTMGWNQHMGWVLFNVLSFACKQHMSAREKLTDAFRSPQNRSMIASPIRLRR